MDGWRICLKVFVFHDWVIFSRLLSVLTLLWFLFPFPVFFVLTMLALGDNWGHGDCGGQIDGSNILPFPRLDIVLGSVVSCVCTVSLCACVCVCAQESQPISFDGVGQQLGVTPRAQLCLLKQPLFYQLNWFSDAADTLFLPDKPGCLCSVFTFFLTLPLLPA